MVIPKQALINIFFDDETHCLFSISWVLNGILFVWLTVIGSVALASDSLIREVVLPESISSAQSIAIDGMGRVWFAEKVGKKLVVFDLAKNKFESFSLPSSWGEFGFSKLAMGSGGDIWFTMHRWAENAIEPNMLGRFTPADGYFTKYDLSIEAIPDDLFIGSDGVIWFLAANKNSLYRVNPNTFKVKGYPIPTKNSSPRSLVADANGHIWFSEANANKIGKFVPEDEIFYEYIVPTNFANPGEITIDKDGRVWFVELTTNRIGVFYPDLLRFDEAIIPTPRSSPNAIAADGNGNLWFLEYRGNKVGVFNPETAVFYEYDIPTFSSLPGELAIDYEQSILWFTESNTEAKRLGMLSIKEVLEKNRKQEIANQKPSPKQEVLVKESKWALSGWLTPLMVIVAIAVAGGWFRYSKSVR